MVRVTPMLLAAVTAADFPVPPVQTETQKQIFEEKSKAAKKASDAATSEVLALFGSDGFRRAMLDCCPAVAKMSAQEVLERFRAEVRAAELAHTFPLLRHIIPDWSIETAMDHEWFVNLDQASLLAGYTGVTGAESIEEQVYGCKPFAQADKATWDEASSRLIYVANNLLQFDLGSVPIFGDAAAVFDGSAVQDMVLISPADTGNYFRVCHPGEAQTVDFQEALGDEPFFNCSAWPSETVGTMEHMDHIILANLHFYYQDPIEGAKAILSHSGFAGDYSSRTAESSAFAFQYYEANILGNPRLRGGVKHLIASFPKLFGKKEGKQLQDLAAHFDWPLFWAWGYGTQEKSTVGNRRFMDPQSAAVTNATLASSASADFETAWEEASQAEADKLDGIWTKLSSQLFVAPVSATSCADASCVATEIVSGSCICKSSAVLV